MPSKASSHVLTDHDEIQRWAEERKAKPAAVRSTENEGDIGIIRLDFPGYSAEDSLEEVSWDEWFDQFDDRNLALVVQEDTANGKPSNFNKLVSRDSVDDSEQSGRRSRAASSSTKKKSKSAAKRADSTNHSTNSGRTASRKSQESRSTQNKKAGRGKAA